MSRWLDRRFIIPIACICGHTAFAASASHESASETLERFLASDRDTAYQYRALRHFEAQTTKLDKSAWMEVWTEADASGFRYEIAAEGGAGVIRSKVFKEALETEQRMWQDSTTNRGAITRDNYLFVECGEPAGELTCVSLQPRRKETLLIEGAMFLDPASGDLVLLEGSLSKNPSFWTRKVDILRRYERIGGVSVPVEVRSTANVRMAGLSTFTISYEYETINGLQVGTPTAATGPPPQSRLASR